MCGLCNNVFDVNERFVYWQIFDAMKKNIFLYNFTNGLFVKSIQFW